MDDTDVHRLLDLIYGTAIDPALWPEVLRQLSRLTGSHGAVMTRQNERTGEGGGVRAEPLPEAGKLYYGYFATRNVFLEAENALAAVKSYRPSVLTDEHKVSKDRLLRSEYYNDFMRQFDFHSVLMFRMAIDGMETVVLNLHRTRRAGRFSQPSIDLANVLLPHLIRAFNMGRTLAAERSLTASLTLSQARSPHGVFVVDGYGRLRHANAAGHAMAAGRGALRLLAGRLTAAEPDAARRLEGLIGRATALEPGVRTSGTMSMRAPGHPAPLSVTVIPACSETLSVFAQPRTAIVNVVDPEARLSLSGTTLRDLFGLTPAETRVATALFEGLDPPAAAERLNLSVATVRTHLAHIFDKTEVHSQVALSRLLMRTLGARP